MDKNDVHANNIDSSDEYEYVDDDNDLSKQFSQALILGPSNKQRNPSLKHGPCLEFVLSPYVVL